MSTITIAQCCENCKFKKQMTHKYLTSNVCLLHTKDGVNIPPKPNTSIYEFKINHSPKYCYLFYYYQNNYIAEDDFVDATLKLMRNGKADARFEKGARKYYQSVVAYLTWWENNIKQMRQITDGNVCNSFSPKAKLNPTTEELSNNPDKYPFI